MCYCIIFGIIGIWNLIPDSSATPHKTSGHLYTLYTRRSYNNIRALFFNDRFAKVWNSLPADHVDFSSFSSFKRTVDQIFTPVSIVLQWRSFPFYYIFTFVLLHCALASFGAVYCYRSCLCVCVFTTGGRAGGVRTLLQPARAVFASLRALFSFHFTFLPFSLFLGCCQRDVTFYSSLCVFAVLLTC